MSAEIIPFPQTHRGRSLADELRQAEFDICQVFPKPLRNLFLKRLRRAVREIEGFFRAGSDQIPVESLLPVCALEVVDLNPLHNVLDRLDAIQLFLDLAFVRVMNRHSRSLSRTWKKMYAHVGRELNDSRTRSSEHASGGLS